MKFEEKAQVEIIKSVFNPKKQINLMGCYNQAHEKLVYTDNHIQIFTIPLSDLYIDYIRCFPKSERIDKLLYNELSTELCTPTYKLCQVEDGRILEEFKTIEGKSRSMWIDRKLLARFEQPVSYTMGESMLYLENDQGERYGAICKGASI